MIVSMTFSTGYFRISYIHRIIVVKKRTILLMKGKLWNIIKVIYYVILNET